jgi:predicted transposase YbfD/YdcC
MQHGDVIRSHWVLDMTFREDESRVRDKNARENVALLRRMALNLLQAAKPRYKKSMSIKGLRKKANWEPKVLE